MKTLNELGLRVPEILLPAHVDLNKWAVIACDQYTQDREYWKNVEKTVGDEPSTLNLILPEVYLGDADKAYRIQKIRAAMSQYLEGDVFAEPFNGFVYVERKTGFGRTRRGLVVQIDLETYEWKPFSNANIRATEATIIDRIPPRKEIRMGAPLELPHIMLLVNDKEDLLVGGAQKLTSGSGRKPLYNGDLMSGGGSITGWGLSSEDDIAKITDALNRIADANTADDGSTFLFAVGDGNHSLATAKAVWDEYKEKLLENGESEKNLESNPVRYALVEVVNIYDQGLTFEPIHRVLFNAKIKEMIEFVSENLGGKISACASESELEKLVHDSNAGFGFVYTISGKTEFKFMSTDIQELAVSRMQPVLDEYIAANNMAGGNLEIDYIHGSDEVFRLGKKEGVVTLLFPPIAKDSFFATIQGRGPLPRKSFSMGEASEKRYYLECRRLF
ncbi:MAG: DUF1015 domain-containing protein [Treponema sp.]|nr:DUF1015 domain-containing protein [Treponema sp.]